MSHLNESCHIWASHITCERVMSHPNKSCHIRISHVTSEQVMSHLNETCHIWMSHVTYQGVIWHKDVMSPMQSFDTGRSHITNENNLCHIQKWDRQRIPHSHKQKPCQIGRSHVKYGRVMSHAKTSCHACSHIQERHRRRVPHTMGWLRWVGSLKVKVFFAKEPYKRDDILQKRPIILRSLLIVATPYRMEQSSQIWRSHVSLNQGLFCKRAL